MGMRLVGLVLNKWAAYVPNRAFRVLMRMAYSAHDKPNGRIEADLYVGGREPLLDAILDGEKRNPEALDKSIQRAIKELIQLGAIERVNRASSGSRAVYRLTLENPIRIDGRHQLGEDLGDTHRPPLGDTHRPPKSRLGDTECPIRGTLTDPPRSKKDSKEELVKEEVAELSLPVTLARANTDGEPRKESPVEKKCGNEDCELGYRYDPSKPKGQRNIPCPECRPHKAPVIPVESHYSKRQKGQ